MKISNSEKLILMMLCEIYEHQKIKCDIDPKFVQSAIHSGNTWGLTWKYPGIFGDSVEPTPPIVSEVVNFLDMWSFIEDSYDQLSAKDKAVLEAEASPSGKDPHFRGFDGNNEGDYMNVADFLLDDLGRFSKLKKHARNSHMQIVPAYRRMYEAFEPIRKTLGGGLLSLSQMIQVLNAMRYPGK